jgi:hypothetical protein
LAAAEAPPPLLHLNRLVWRGTALPSTSPVWELSARVILLPRRVHLGDRSPTEADAIHQAVQQDRESGPVGLRRSDEAHRMIAVQVVRTVHFQIVIVMRYVSGS